MVAYSLFRKSEAAGDLVFFPKGLRKLDWDGGPVIEFNLGIANTSNQSFDINALAGDAFTNSTYIGYVSSFQKTVIGPRQEGILPIRVKLSLIGLVTELLDGIQNGNWKQDVKLNLRANVDNLTVPIILNYKFG